MYKQITRDERVCIALLLRKQYSYKNIAKELGFHRTTIMREVRRNNINGIYNARHAQRKTKERKKVSKIMYRLLDTDLRRKRMMLKYLRKDWSPEQINGVFNTVSHMTIYRYLNRNSEYKILLRRHGKKRRKYGTRGIQSRYQANKRSIHERGILPNVVGHWEGDTIVGKERKLRIITHVDVSSGYLVAHLSDASADGVYHCAKQYLQTLPCKTITYDNGSEFALHKMIEDATGAEVYFADPGKPHQRGSNENVNGLLRQYFPKGSSFANITDKDVQRAVRKLNSRPRKRLNYLTPKQVFKGCAVDVLI
jgi:IS30 family transposase